MLPYFTLQKVKRAKAIPDLYAENCMVAENTCVQSGTNLMVLDAGNIL